MKNLKRNGVFEPISFQVREGEVLGRFRLMGAGRTEIARCLFGMDACDGGEIWLNGERLQIHSPREALKMGICYVSEDRRGEGIIPLRGVRENICLSAMDQMCSHGYRKRIRRDGWGRSIWRSSGLRLRRSSSRLAI